LGVTCGPGVDPSMPIHRDPRAWEGLLGRCADAFMEGVGTWSRTSRALRSFGAPSAARIPPARPRGLRPRREGCARRRRVGMGAGTCADMGIGPLRAAPHADLEAVLGLVGPAPAATYAASRLFDRAGASLSLE
jgi:hypothetical protein